MSNKYVDSAGLGEYTKKVKSAIGVAMSDSMPKKDIEQAAIASFDDGAENVPVNALTVGIESQQNLNGFDNPWPDGGGVNKFDLTKFEYRTTNGITFARDGNDIVISGTASGDAYLNFSGLAIAGSGSSLGIIIKSVSAQSNVMLRFAVTGGGDSRNMRLETAEVSNSITYNDTDTYSGYILVNSGANFSTPIRVNVFAATYTDVAPSYSPYSNICPIYSQAEKNILPLDLDTIKAANTSGTWSGNNYVLNGLTFAVQTDSDSNILGIGISGTSSASTWFAINSIANINTQLTSGKSYILNGCPSAAGLSLVLGESGSDTGSGKTFTAPATGGNAGISINSGNTYSGVVVYPMIRDAANPDPTFVPYRCVARVDIRGANLLNFESEDIGWAVMYPDILALINSLPNGAYTMSMLFTLTQVTTQNGRCRIRLFAGTTLAAEDTQNWGTADVGATKNMSITFTVTDENRGKFSSIYLYACGMDGIGVYGHASATNCMMNVGATAEPYVAYNGDRTYFVIDPDDHGTVYKGTAEYKGGGEWEITDAHLPITFDDVTLVAAGTTPGTGYYRYRYVNADIAPYTVSTDAKATALRYQVGYNAGPYTFYNGSGEMVLIFDASSTFDTAAKAKQWLVDNEVLITVPRVTPATFTVTGPTPETLLGDNNIWSNTGDISVTYAVDTNVAIEEEVGKYIPAAPSEDGSYQLTVTVTDGVPVYSWEAVE